MNEYNNRDIEETPEQLDEIFADADEGQQVRQRWERAQRDLITQVIDYTADTIVNFIGEGLLDLNPIYQRRDRWDVKRNSRLIESFLLNIPIPPVYLSENPDSTFLVIDGKQRLNAIHGFLNGEYALKGLQVFREAEGLRFDQLEVPLQRALQARASVRAVILLHISDPTVQYEVFHRLNTGGVALNAQEIRNSTFPGPLNELIMELSEHPEFHEALGIKEKSQSAIWREMRDAELVLRYFAFRDEWKRPLVSIADTLNGFMAENSRLSDRDRITLRQDFLSSLEKARSAFGDLLFRKWDRSGGRVSPIISSAMYDAQMLAVKDFEITTLRTHSEEIRQESRDILSRDDQGFSTWNVNNARSLHKRITIFREMISEIVGR